VSNHELRNDLADLFDIIDRALKGTPEDQKAALLESRRRIASIARAA
jgi:hypothetical protein